MLISFQLALFVFAIATYLAVIVPALRTVVEPIPDVDTYTEQVQALQLVSAGNVINIVIFIIILSLQVCPFISGHTVLY
jgi:hypothetical protein